MSLFGRKLSFSSTASNSKAKHKHTYCIYESLSVSATKTSLYLIVNAQNGDLRIKKSLDKSNFGSQTNMKYMNNVKNINVVIESIEDKVSDSVRLIIEFKLKTIGNKKTKKGNYKHWDILFKKGFIRNECVALLNIVSVKLKRRKLRIIKEAMKRPKPWISDSKVKKCQICLDNFNSINRKHHCRSCGKILCAKCSSKSGVLPSLGIRDIVRICDICYRYIVIHRMKLNQNGLLSNDELYYIDYIAYTDDDGSGNGNGNDEESEDNKFNNEYYYGVNKHWRKFICAYYRGHRLDPFSHDLRQLTRQGIPSILRGYVWKNMISSRLTRKKIINECKSNDTDLDKSEYLGIIEKDLQRTHPIHSIYKSAQSIALLRNVLIEYSKRNRKIGYCQSMNFIGAILLLFLNESDSFQVLKYLIEKVCCLFDEYYYHQSDILGVKIDGFVFNDSIQRYLPSLHKHFVSIMDSHKSNIITSLTYHWFLSLFSQSLKLKSLLTVWDNMICYDSINVIFRAALSILRIKKEELMNCKDYIGMHNVLANESILKDDKIQNCHYFIRICYNNEFRDIDDFIYKRRLFHKNKLNNDYIESVVYNNNTDIQINLISDYSTQRKQDFISLNTPRRSISKIGNMQNRTKEYRKSDEDINGELISIQSFSDETLIISATRDNMHV